MEVRKFVLRRCLCGIAVSSFLTCAGARADSGLIEVSDEGDSSAAAVPGYAVLPRKQVAFRPLPPRSTPRTQATSYSRQENLPPTEYTLGPSEPSYVAYPGLGSDVPAGDMCCDFGEGCDGCSTGYASCAPWWGHMSGISGEFLYLHATDADLHHAQQQDGTGGAGTVPFGLIGQLDPIHEPAFRVGASKAFTDCSSIAGSYTFFESRADNALVPPVIPGGGGAVGSLVHHPGAAITASVGPVNATYDIDFQLADIEYRSVWKASSLYVINWSLGARYGQLEQSFAQNGVFAGGSAGVINTVANANFDGGGVRFGLDGERRIGAGGFSLYGRGSVAPMTGSLRANYTLRNATTDVLLANSIWKDDRIITTLDYEAGISWTSQQRKWRASAGYMASIWFNTATIDEYVNAVQANSYADVGETLSFEGLTARIERRW